MNSEDSGREYGTRLAFLFEPPSESPPAAPPYAPIDVAYRELMQGLWVAYKLFKEKGDGGISGCHTACHAVIRFLAVRHENPELAAAFIRMHDGFGSLLGGVIPELFRLERETSERSRSDLRKYQQLWAAVCMEFYMRQGESQVDAAKRVARAVGKWAYFKGDRVTETTIQSWRDQVKRPTDRRRANFLKIIEHVERRKDSKSYILNVLRKGPSAEPAAPR